MTIRQKTAWFSRVMQMYYICRSNKTALLVITLPPGVARAPVLMIRLLQRCQRVFHYDIADTIGWVGYRFQGNFQGNSVEPPFRFTGPRLLGYFRSGLLFWRLPWPLIQPDRWSVYRRWLLCTRWLNKLSYRIIKILFWSVSSMNRGSVGVWVYRSATNPIPGGLHRDALISSGRPAPIIGNNYTVVCWIDPEYDRRVWTGKSTQAFAFLSNSSRKTGKISPGDLICFMAKWSLNCSAIVWYSCHKFCWARSVIST